ncbi:HNH endonuclease [Rhizobiaceae bacterium CRRU44]|uniref:Putative HNH nuclease YajD n=1 Tax=Ferranicluibacter rubi TaxID=2715133 RepID=A0AA44CDJ9_9HYPH|nr:HNH endonuclease signature motif containing protein [Ferranicluibacter rubi]NHT77541.1 HNH endonuclease [Ferranicluibacter rubi]
MERKLKLSQLRPTIGRLPPLFGPVPGDEKERNRFRSQSEPWRKLYTSARWKRLRIATFRRALFTCQMCGKIEGNTSLLICDHVKPHKGDEDLFFDPDNLQTLCVPCHDGPKKRQERADVGR